MVPETTLATTLSLFSHYITLKQHAFTSAQRSSLTHFLKTTLKMWIPRIWTKSQTFYHFLRFVLPKKNYENLYCSCLLLYVIYKCVCVSI